MDKIYSRPRLVIPKININVFNNKLNKYSSKDNNKNNNKDINIRRKLLSLIVILIVAGITISKINGSISKILEQQCKMQAKSIATRISNQQATAIMKNYNYDDLFKTIKDSNRKCYND